MHQTIKILQLNFLHVKLLSLLIFNLVLIANLTYEAKVLNLRNPYEVLCQKLFLNLAILLRFSLAHSCVIACHSNRIFLAIFSKVNIYCPVWVFVSVP